MASAPAFATALGGGLAVALPAVLLAQVLDAMADDDLSALVAVPLALVALAGALVGGALVRRRPGGAWALAALVGAAVMALIGGLGAARTSVAGESTDLALLATSVGAGALLGIVGGAVGPRWPARTRR